MSVLAVKISCRNILRFNLVRSAQNYAMSAQNVINPRLPTEDHDIIYRDTVTSPHLVIPLAGQDQFSRMASRNSGTDLQRFLQEVGTNTREARYWLKTFQRTTNDLNRVFAVLHIEEEVIKTPDLLKSLCSCLAFLHRHNMRMVLVHGSSSSSSNQRDSMGDETVVILVVQALRRQLISNTVILSDALEAQGAPARPLMPGSHIFQVSCRPSVSPSRDNNEFSNSPKSPNTEAEGNTKEKLEISKTRILESQAVNNVEEVSENENLRRNELGGEAGGWSVGGVDSSLVEWAIKSGAVAIVPGVGETEGGQLVPLRSDEAAAELAKALQPLKVLLVNERGGILDETGQVVPQIKLPNDLQTILSKPWCTDELKLKIDNIASLLSKLSPQSSTVIVSASRLLPELFTHRGSGTFFQITEGVRSYSDLSDVDVHSLAGLIEQGFEKKLKDSYIPELSRKLKNVYIIDGYTAAAVLTTEKQIPVPYLDKFVVSTSRQGESSGQTLWDNITKDHPCLFWRSRKENPINTWYFNRSVGSRTVGRWTVFWYGEVSESLSSQMINYAVNLPPSFTDEPVSPDDSQVGSMPTFGTDSPAFAAVNKYLADLRIGEVKNEPAATLPSY